jgi:predicted  nucleic acid-binding Zn-ribbon protein
MKKLTVFLLFSLLSCQLWAADDFSYQSGIDQGLGQKDRLDQVENWLKDFSAKMSGVRKQSDLNLSELKKQTLLEANGVLEKRSLLIEGKLESLSREFTDYQGKTAVALGELKEGRTKLEAEVANLKKEIASLKEFLKIPATTATP